MLSYLHAFHAGNFADVQKHSALVLALRMMQAKASPIAMFDTHGGSARYDLMGDRARKTAEAEQGIHKFWAARQTLTSDDWAPILARLNELNNLNDSLTVYPGSPEWFSYLQRKNDAFYAWELHPAEGQSLVNWAKGRTGIRVSQGDGLKGLLGQLPPKQPRLLALLDPSYEVKTEYQAVAETLSKAWKLCRHGVYLIWYPLLPEGNHERLKSAVAESGIRKVWCQEAALTSRPSRGMWGSGLMVINPPWGFEERLQAMMDDVAGNDVLGLTLTDQWLVPE